MYLDRIKTGTEESIITLLNKRELKRTVPIIIWIPFLL